PSWCPVSRKEMPMKKAVLGCAFVFLVGVSGCGSSADSLLKDQIKLMNDVADAMEKGDEAKVKDLQKRMEELKKKLDELKLSDEEVKKAWEKHKDEFAAAKGRVFQAGMKKGQGGMNKGLEDATKKGIDDAMNKGNCLAGLFTTCTLFRTILVAEKRLVFAEVESIGPPECDSHKRNCQL